MFDYQEQYDSYLKWLREGCPGDDKVKGYWTQTITGVQFRPYDPTPEMINIEDIAAALSKQCRYNGHIGRFYTVAEHSMFTSWLVRQMEDTTLLDERTALLHDAVEAYIGDMPAPVKWGNPWFNALEQFIWERAVAPKFCLPTELPKCVKLADVQMLVLEKLKGIEDFGHKWSLEGIEVPTLHFRGGVHRWIVADSGVGDLWYMDPDAAEEDFLYTFARLQNELDELFQEPVCV